MCIIIDTNCFSHVFNKSDSEHFKFKPVLDWILNDKGFILYGGTKYYNELSRTKYAKLFSLLQTYRKDKVVKLDKELVDKREQEIKKIIPDKEMDPTSDFDDPHLPAIALVGKCHVICSLDNRSEAYVLDKRLYPHKFLIPRYYKGLECQNLLSEKYINDIYKPLKGKCNKKNAKMITDFCNSK